MRGGGDGSASTETVSDTERVSVALPSANATDDVLGVDLGDLALLAGREALVLEQVQQVLGLVLEAQDA